MQMAVDPTGRNVLAVSRFNGNALLIPVDGGKPRLLPTSSLGSGAAVRFAPAFSADGHFAAVSTIRGPKGSLIEVYDLLSGKVQALNARVGDQNCGGGLGNEGLVQDARFTSDGRILAAGIDGLRLWSVAEGTSTLLRPGCKPNVFSALSASSEDRFLLADSDDREKAGTASFYDLRAHVSRELASHGKRIWSVALDTTGRIAVTGDFDGVVRVGPVTGEDPHLLYGHTLAVVSVAVSPDGRWIASGSQDGTIRLWPMPEGQPFHTLPREQVRARLRSFTNLRVVADKGTDTGYRVQPGPFPGWAKRPEP